MDTPESASGKKPDALFLSPEAPYPPIGGGPLRSASLLEYLARDYTVHLVAFRQRGEPDPSAAIPPGRVHRVDLLDLPYHSKGSIARVLRNTRRLARNRPPLVDRFSGLANPLAALLEGRHYQAAVIEHFWCAAYVEQVRACSEHVALDLHNIESAWHESLARQERSARRFALRRFAAAAAALERKWLPAFDSILVASRLDAERVRGLALLRDITVYPNALPEMPQPTRQEREEIVFSGNLEYAPNISAVQFFRRNIWTALRASRPNLKWRIVGKNPQAVSKLVAGDDRIELSGPVEDAVAELAKAQVAVVPVLAGSGTRVKILEAWAAGTPVVSTRLGVEGLDCEDGTNVLIADDASGFTNAVARLLESGGERARIGSAGRHLFEKQYTWPAAWKSLDPIFGNRAVTRKL
jgi:glycosyltransferase involved in cell wall biosynthesis